MGLFSTGTLERVLRTTVQALVGALAAAATFSEVDWEAASLVVVVAALTAWVTPETSGQRAAVDAAYREGASSAALGVPGEVDETPIAG